MRSDCELSATKRFYSKEIAACEKRRTTWRMALSKQRLNSSFSERTLNADERTSWFGLSAWQ
jgi:hypothetical protein